MKRLILFSIFSISFVSYSLNDHGFIINEPHTLGSVMQEISEVMGNIMSLQDKSMHVDEIKKGYLDNFSLALTDKRVDDRNRAIEEAMDKVGMPVDNLYEFIGKTPEEAANMSNTSIRDAFQETIEKLKGKHGAEYEGLNLDNLERQVVWVFDDAENKNNYDAYLNRIKEGGTTEGLTEKERETLRTHEERLTDLLDEQKRLTEEQNNNDANREEVESSNSGLVFEIRMFLNRVGRYISESTLVQKLKETIKTITGSGGGKGTVHASSSGPSEEPTGGESGYGESGYGESGYGEPGYGEPGYEDPTSGPTDGPEGAF